MLVCRLARAAGEESPTRQTLSVRAAERALDTARGHNILGLILPALRRARAEWPAHLEAQLHQAETSLAVQALFRESELQTLLRVLEDAGVQFAVLKGAFLASCVYADFAERPMSDFDFLLRRSDLPVAAAALRDAGYLCENRGASPADPGGEAHFRSPAGQAVELHDSLTQGTRLRGIVHLDEPEMWPRRGAFETRNGQHIWSLDATDHLLYLSYHAGILHLFAALIWLSDIDRFVRRFQAEIAWSDLPERARRLGCATSLWHGLALARRLLGTPCDDALLHSLQPPKPRATLIQHLLTAPRLLQGLAPPSQVRLALVQTLLLDSVMADLRSSWRGLFPPRMWMEWRYRTSNPVTLFFRRALYPVGGWLRRPR
jgi:hypothetical protein